MNIGLLTPYWPTTDPDGGIGHNSHRAACALAARGHQVTVFHINKKKPFWHSGIQARENEFNYIEIPCRVFPSRSWRGSILASHFAGVIMLYLKGAKRLRNIEVMEASSHGGFAWFYFRFLARRKVPTLIRISTTGTQMRNRQIAAGGFYGDWIEHSLIRSARHTCTHTMAHRDEVCAGLGLDPKRMAVIPHGVPLPELPVRSAAQEKFVLVAGRFEPRKGTDTALRAVPLVLVKQPDCRFIFAGGGEKADAWTKKFLEEHGRLTDYVRFLGLVPVDKLNKLYQTCDFFVSPALYESFGMTYLEAMGYGKPVIGCLKSGGAEEVISDGGLLVRPGDAEHLAETIIRLWTDRELHQKLSVRARLRAEYFSMDLKAKRVEQHYAKMIAGEI